MRTRSKRYNKDSETFSKESMTLDQAVAKLKGWGSTKFNQTVECVMHLGIDPRQADQAIRGGGFVAAWYWKDLRVVVFCEGDDIEKAKAAGAIEADADDLVAKVSGGWLDFDVAIAHPKMMGKVGKLGRVLGPQGKMPSPKSGTVTPNIENAVKEYAAGKVEYRNDSGGNIHIPVGKLNFDSNKLEENIAAFIDLIKKAKPSASKGTYIKKCAISATMSPSILIDVS